MKAVLPFRHTWISQGINGYYSHQKTKAIDFGSLSTYQDFNLYASFDGTVVWADPVSKGGTIAFQSDDKVEFADGTIDYMTVITEHDNTRPNVNTHFNKGDLYSHMGTAGGVSKHSHIEVQRGKFVKPTKTIYQPNCNMYVYAFDNTVNPYDALFITRDTIIRSVKEGSVVEYPWKVEEEMEKLITIKLDDEYDYKFSLDGAKYGTPYSITTMSGHYDEQLRKDGWEELVATNGGLFYSYDNTYYANGLEKSCGVNNQDITMSAVKDYNDAMAIGLNEDITFAKQSYIVSKLDDFYGAVTGIGVLLNGKACSYGHTEFASQYNTISGRTIWGESEDGRTKYIYCIEGATGKSGLYGKDLATKCKSLGMYNAICLDGGGSVWMRTNQTTNVITTSRKTKNAVLVYRKRKATTDYKALYEEELKKNEELKSSLDELKTQVDSLESRLIDMKKEIEISNNKLNQIKEIVE